MSLKNLRATLVDYIKGHDNYIRFNQEVFQIYQGGLEPFVQETLRDSLSKNYYDKIQSRIITINILKRVIDKMSKVYANTPNRITEDKYKDFVAYYEEKLQLNSFMNMADEYSNLFKGYLLEPFLYKGKHPKMRTIPYDRFLPWSDDIQDPTVPTAIIKFMGKKPVTVKVDGKDVIQMRDIFFVYTEDEFDAFDIEGETFNSGLDRNGGVNPFGIIPAVYGNRSRQELVPIQNTDMKRMAIMTPVQLSDLAGAIMFQCFSIIYTIDVDMNDVKMSPNALWEMKSDLISGKTPQVGTISPKVDSDKVLAFISAQITMWLETLGVKVGAMGNASAGALSSASGVAKLIDEMDTFEIRKIAIENFKVEEKEYWDLLRIMHNKWVETAKLLDPEAKSLGLIDDKFEITIEFDEPKPLVDRGEEIKNVKEELELGTMTQVQAIEFLHPDLTPKQVREVLKENSINGDDSDGTTEGEDTDTEEIPEKTDTTR